MAVWSPLTEALNNYLGLSPAAFFTIVALMVVTYKVVCGMFVAAEDYVAVKNSSEFVVREPVQLGDVTEEELRTYDGSDPNKPLLMAIKGQIYDVSRSKMFYGPGGPYASFAGRDASRALALMSFDPNDLTGNTEGLSPSELEVLQDWEYQFMGKYVKVGQIVPNKNNNEDAMEAVRTDVNGVDAGRTDQNQVKAVITDRNRVEEARETDENKVETRKTHIDGNETEASKTDLK